MKKIRNNDIYGDCSFGRFNTSVAFWSYMVRSPIQSYVLVVIDFCQHDGYYIDCRPFTYTDIGNLENVFKTRKDAEAAIDKLMKGNKQ